MASIYAFAPTLNEIFESQDRDIKIFNRFLQYKLQKVL